MAPFHSLIHHGRRPCFNLFPPPSFSRNLGLIKFSYFHLTPQSPAPKPSNDRPIFAILGLSRQLCSSSSPSSNPQTETETAVPARNRSPSTLVRPISYPAKPADESPAEEPARPSRQEREAWRRAASGQPETDATATEARQWTREDIRYVKDSPSISPVSYAPRVAPLPEDNVVADEVPKVQEGRWERNEELEQERRKIVAEQERRKFAAEFQLRKVLKEQEEDLPFPTLITVEKKPPKPIFDLQDAIKEVKANAKRKFIETVEAHVNLGVDPRRGDQMVRGAATLPHGTGKTVRVAVFAEGAAAEEARGAGADVVGGDELIEAVKNGGGKLNFDKCISTPTFMPRLGKIARILGPRGLMPNPKLGSVTSNVAAAVQEAKRGRIDFKIDKTGIVHVGLGKVNFSDESLQDNVAAFVNALLLAKPAGLKKTSKYAGYVKSFTLSSTMGSGYPVSIQSLSIVADNYNKLQQLK